jgi:hypothetical protein
VVSLSDALKSHKRARKKWFASEAPRFAAPHSHTFAVNSGFSTSGAAVRCCPCPHLESVDVMDLEEEVLMLTLLSKRIYKKERRHQYWVHPVLCTRLETGQFYTLFYEFTKDENEFFKLEVFIFIPT